MKQHFVNQQTLKQLAYDNGLDLVPTWELDENLQTRYALIGFKSEAQINHVMSLCDNFERVVIVRKPFDNCWRLSDLKMRSSLMNPCMKMPLTVFHFATTLPTLKICCRMKCIWRRMALMNILFAKSLNAFRR